MTRRTTTAEKRRGVTLLEVMAAAAISATMMTSSMIVIRSSYAAWQAQEADTERAAMASAVLRQVVREVRQSVDVTYVTGSGVSPGALVTQRADATVPIWFLSGTQVAYYPESTLPATTLATDIAALEFVGYQADGVTETTTASEIRSIRCAVTTNLPAGGSRTVSTRVWLRSW